MQFLERQIFAIDLNSTHRFVFLWVWFASKASGSFCGFCVGLIPSRPEGVSLTRRATLVASRRAGPSTHSGAAGRAICMSLFLDCPVRCKVFPVLLRQRLWPTQVVANHVQCFARRQQFARGLVENLIPEAQCSPLRLGQSCSNREQIVKSRRPLVTAVGFGNDNKTVILDLHLFVFESELSA